MAGILAWFWNERFWLPHNVTWADLKNTEEATFPQVEDLYLSFPFAFCIYMIRLVFERFVAKPCAMRLKIQNNGPMKAQPNAILEKVFTAITKHPDEKRLEGLSKQLDWDVRSIQRWFRQRRNQEKPSIVKRFCESMWMFTFHLHLFIYQIWFMKTMPWFWNLRQCWENYPYQDFGLMVVHHCTAVLLLTSSYVINMVRMGTLIMSLHDVNDLFLQAAKLANYTKCQKLCDLLFGLFAILFIVTRLCIYPLWLLNSTLFDSWEIVGPFPSWWFMNFLLLIIQVLNFMWSCIIIKMVWKAFSKGKVSKDDRSDVESSSDDEDSVSYGKNIHSKTSNGTTDASDTNGYLSSGICSEEH
ncbi:ceramide synthase 6 isoform X2 [Microcaecilia unicolor]|uniref:Ceramide synthase 6 isoform X2 n=1 Tax=Microcaecilia unicolor TaxID=1415580 RepID=A0A6P7YQ17_9AMPH|nr:ceramide synthase 6 isoform X2 [Microcaecilia unicolor]